MTLPEEEESPKACIFPFMFQGVSYDHCAWSGNGSVYHCSTKNDKDGNMVKKGNCGPSCPLPEGEERCKTDKDEKCIFPFRFNNETYESCTWAYSNTAWCSTQVDSSGVHIGGTKGTCKKSGCRIPPRPEGGEQKELPKKEFYDVLKDIFFKDF